MERRLSAIFAADMVGYSRLMEADESGTIERQKAHRRELINPAFEEFHGRIVKEMGDGILVEFPSVVDAVQCAVKIQRTMPGRVTADDRRIIYRIGINLGDIVAEGDDIYGDGVNVAARLQQLAEPGGICISGTAYDTVVGKLDLAFEDGGMVRLRNITRPVHVYHLAAGQRRLPLTNRRAGSAGRPSIIVLPFVNLSGDADQEFLADGLTEDIISALASWHYFPVASRSSSFLYKGRPIDAREIGRQLGVRYVVGGSIRKGGGRLRIKAQLEDAVTGSELWSEHFDRNLDDVFELQDEITHRIAAIITPELEKAEARSIILAPLSILGAWEAVQRGTALLYFFTKEGNAEARKMFQRAIELDGDYSKAYTGLAYSYHRDIFWHYANDREASIGHFLEAASRAVQLDDTDSSAHLVLGYAHIWTGDYDLAEAEERRAVELNQSNAFAHVALGEAIDLDGRPDGAFEPLEKGIDLNPRDPRVHTFIGALARAHLNARDYEQAVEVGRRALERRSDYPHANAYLISALGHLGRKSEAEAAFRRCSRLLSGFASAYRNAGDVEHFYEGLVKAGMNFENGDI